MTTETIEASLVLKDIEIKKAALILRAIKHPLRQRILQLIHSKGQMTVSTIYHKLNLEQSVASQHLAILRKARLVTTRREGKFIFYSVNYAHVDHVHSICAVLIGG